MQSASLQQLAVAGFDGEALERRAGIGEGVVVEQGGHAGGRDRRRRAVDLDAEARRIVEERDLSVARRLYPSVQLQHLEHHLGSDPLFGVVNLYG